MLKVKYFFNDLVIEKA